MVTFMLGIFSILTTDMVAHFMGLSFAVASGLLIYHAVHME